MPAYAVAWEPAFGSRNIGPRMAPAGVGGRTRMPAEPDEPRVRPGTVDGTDQVATAASDPDVALMLRLQAGDQGGFQELFRKWSPRVLQYVRRLVGSDAQAEEVTQDVFVQVFRFRHRYRPQSRLATWIFTIATNLSLNELRRPERQLRVDLWERHDEDASPEGPPLPDPHMPTPEQGASTRELSRRLEAAIGELPPKQRAALLLSRLDGLAYRDVADALGCTEGAVKALLFRATQTLKQRIRDFL
jgi:RNA polymerase sigma-70 factor (ECF subfamily)